jgi:archaeal flagellar protein FlaC
MGKGEDVSVESETKEEKTSEPAAAQKVENTNAKESADTKKDVDSLRKIIKLGSTEETTKEDQKSTDSSDIAHLDDSLKSSDLTSRESLEQRRAILQSIKDFDFQIKKGQEDINTINQRLESISKDLDDLVSLYEIVSEQMNPFVGLSKVTKKRLDSLENFTKEIDALKTRIGDLESFAGRPGMKLEDFKGEQSTHINNIGEELTDLDLDKIIERSFKELTAEANIDILINEFVESLKKCK